MEGKRLGKLVTGLCFAVLTVSPGALAHTAPAQEGSVTGRVVDAIEHDVLDAVRVTVKGTDLRDKTDEFGSFAIEKVPVGPVALSFSRSGYKSREIVVSVVPGLATRWTVALWKLGR